MTLDAISLRALADCRRNARGALAAMRAMSTAHLTRDELTALSRVASLLADAVAELEQLEQHARLQP